MSPVLLDIPVDIPTLESEIDAASPFFGLNPDQYRPKGHRYPDPSLVKKTADLLLTAHNPVVISGSGVYWGRASESLLTLAEYLSIPVAYDDLGKGSIPELHPLAIGSAIQNILLNQADFILALGVIFGKYQGFGTNPAFYSEEVKIVHVDPEATEVGKNKPLELGIACSIDPFLKQLLAAVKKLKPKDKLHNEWATTIKTDRIQL